MVADQLEERVGNIADLITHMAIYPEADPAIVGELARSYASVSLDRILEASKRSEGERCDLEKSVKQAFTTARWHCWCPEVGIANGLFELGEGFFDAALLQVVSMAIPWGWVGTVEANLRHPATLAFGACRLRCCGRTMIVADAESVRVTTDDGIYELRRSGRGLWLDGAPTLRINGVDGRSVTAGHRIDPEVLRPEDVPISVERFSEACLALDDALALLTTTSGHARGWVDRITREVTMVAPLPGGVTSSRSTASRPGNLLVTAPIDPLALAEALVHESSHQYFALCGRLGGFVKATHTQKLYYSAINGLHRPIGRLALAMHAIANMFVLYDDILESGDAFHRLAKVRLNDIGMIGNSLANTISLNRDVFLPHVLNFIDLIVKTIFDIGKKHGLTGFDDSEIRYISG